MYSVNDTTEYCVADVVFQSVTNATAQPVAIRHEKSITVADDV